jgi:hypothetical protein
LNDSEIQHSEDKKHKFEPCKTCIDVGLDAAYSNGFKPGESPVELLEEEPLEALDFVEEINSP